MSLEILKGQNELLQHEVEVAIKENRIAEAIYIATTRSIGYVHTHDHTGEVQRIPSTDPVRDLELLNVEVPVPGGVTALIRAAQFADSKSLEQLIALGVDVEYETIGGLTAFAEACKAGHQQICVAKCVVVPHVVCVYAAPYLLPDGRHLFTNSGFLNSEFQTHTDLPLSCLCFLFAYSPLSCSPSIW